MDFEAAVPKIPEEIFPLEVWAMILNKVESPYDLANCYRTCKALKDLLKPKGATFLMPEVFPILHKYLKNADEEVMKVRTICRSWKASVDSYFRTHPILDRMGKFDFLLVNDEPFPLTKYNFDEFNGDAKLTKFLARNFPLDNNPFLARQIKFSNLQDNSHTPIVRAKFKQMLESYGSQIWNCSLRLGFRSGITELYKRVRSYLLLMPNLRSLTLHIQSSRHHDEVKIREDDEIMLLLQNEPFPKLERLSELEMDRVPFPLSVGILSQNEQLRKLAFNNLYYPDVILPDYFADMEIPSLEHFILNANTYVETAHFQRMTWPLKTLELQLGFGKMDTVFQAMETFSETLEHLSIFYEYAADEENNKDLQSLRLRFPNLKRFQLTTPFKLETIDFLVECRALQDIKLFIGYSSDENDNGGESTSAIQLKNYIKDMQKSNIWNVLPMLGIINIKTTTVSPIALDELPESEYRFTRGQNKKYMKKLNAFEMQNASSSPKNTTSPSTPLTK